MRGVEAEAEAAGGGAGLPAPYGPRGGELPPASYPSARDVEGQGAAVRAWAAMRQVWGPLGVAALGLTSSVLALWLSVAKVHGP